MLQGRAYSCNSGSSVLTNLAGGKEVRLAHHWQSHPAVQRDLERFDAGAAASSLGKLQLGLMESLPAS